MLPKKINFVWIGGPMPAWAERNIEEFRRVNPEHAVKVHDESAILPELAGPCAAISDPSSKSDLVRLSVLWREGGWYFDVDYWPLRPLAEAERAWGLDGRRVFVSRQDHPRVPFNGCVLACGPGSPGLRELIDSALESRPGKDRCIYGPDLLSSVCGRKPGLFTAADWPWFMLKNSAHLSGHYQRALRGDVEPLRRAEARTGGQLPFAIHLWMNARSEEIARAFNAPGNCRPYALVESCDAAHPVAGMAEGLAGLGFEVRRYRKDDQTALDRLAVNPAVLVAWNNVRRARLATVAERRGVPVLWCENGFFQRKEFIQADPEGFLHRASWRRLLSHPAPADGARRLARFYPSGPTPIRAHPEGYMLALGQVAGDTQMADSELNGPLPFQREIVRALPAGTPAFFRPHPQCGPQRRHPMHPQLPILDAAQAERSAYRQTKSGPGLAAALAGARFAVTINSNAAVDALAAGVPVLAFGPHLGIDAGAIRRCTVATLAADLQAMLDGWLPEQAKVDNFLRWLASRQWCREEFASPAVMGALLAEAGVEFGDGRVGPGSLPGPGHPAAVPVAEMVGA